MNRCGRCRFGPENRDRFLRSPMQRIESDGAEESGRPGRLGPRGNEQG
jgi:hypothetical protein